MLPWTVIFALLPLLTFAFQDTVPAVAWASHSSPKLDSLSALVSPFAKSSHFFDALLEGDDLCRYDAVVLAEQPGLHASDLRTLPRSSYIVSRLSEAVSSFQLPYLPHAEGDSFHHFKRSIEERCGSRRVELSLGQGGVNLEKGERHLVCVNMPRVQEDGQERQTAMRDHDSRLSNDIARVASAFPSHLVIYIGSSPFTKRQAITTHTDSDSPVRPVIETSAESVGAIALINTTLPEGGLFQKYRFLTPGLITALLIVFGLLVPVLMIGIYALAGIQSPLRMDTPKGTSLDKKTQ